MSKQKLVIVDADSLCYTSSRETLEESIQVLNEKIQNIYDKTEATHSILLISKGRYFRHVISNNSYKASRGKYTSSLKYLKSLKAYLQEEYNAQYMVGVEADDLAALYMARKWYYAKFTNPHSDSFWMVTDNIEGCDESVEIDVILAAVDKDLLKSIPTIHTSLGHFNYTYKLEDKSKPEDVIKGWWVTTSTDEADKFQWIQMLMGDSTDGVTGIPGVGIVGANKILNEYDAYDISVFNRYMDYYKTSQGIYEFQKNYRLLHLLSTDQDYLREVGELPTFPIVNKIKPKEIITAEYI